jgi:hypothetical protein
MRSPSTLNEKETLMTSLTATDAASSDRRGTFLRRVLLVDAATCIATGALLSLDAGPLAPMLGLPAALLFYAGASLFPTAAFMLWVAMRRDITRTGTWLVIAGNALWVVGSIAILGLAPTGLGYAFVIAQAAVVALLAELEYAGLRKAVS